MHCFIGNMLPICNLFLEMFGLLDQIHLFTQSLNTKYFKVYCMPGTIDKVVGKNKFDTCVEKNSQIVFFLCSHTTTAIVNRLLRPKVWVVFPHSNRHQLCPPIQFWHNLPKDSIRSHRLGAQSQRHGTPSSIANPALQTPIASPGL